MSFATLILRNLATAAVRWLRTLAPASRAVAAPRSLTACLLTAASVSVQASLPALTIDQYRHTSWTVKEGGPSGVHGLAQTRDGHLWLATDSGLVKFDGIAFEPVKSLGGRTLDPDSVLRIESARDGGLWVAFKGRRGLAHIRHGEYTEHPSSEGWGSVQSIVESSDGTPWVVADGRVWRVRTGVIAEVGAEWGYPASASTLMMIADARGTLWAVGRGESVIFYLPPGEAKFRPVQGQFPPAFLRSAPGGGIWLSGPGGLGLLPVEDGRPGEFRAVTRSPYRDMLFDGDGGAWVGGRTGLAHVANARRLLESGTEGELLGDTLTPAQGLSSEIIYSMLEDREGDVWLGTQNGLDRLHRPRFVPVKLPGQSTVFAIAAGDDGAVWAGGDGRLMKILGHDVRQVGDVGPDLHSLYRDARGTLWAGGLGLWRLDGADRLVNVPVPVRSPTGTIRSMVSDGTGTLWVGSDSTVDRLADGRWSAPMDASDVRRKSRVTAMLIDSRGRVWSADLQGISVKEGNSVRRFTNGNDGLDIGTIGTMYQRGPNIWIGGAEGVALFDGVKFRSLRGGDQDPSFRGISGIVETSGGELWLHGLHLALRMPVVEMRRALDHPGTVVAAERFVLDGSAAFGGPQPTLIQASDGRLWVSTTAGLAWIDPLNMLPRQGRAPDVVMRSLIVDGARFNPQDTPAVVPELSRQFELFYGAVSVTLPLRFRFRYRLDEFDTTWQEAGERRSAFYSNLAPGLYHFRVIAANEDGLWGNGQAEFAFRVPPAWFQTIWFHALCGLAGIAVLVLAYQVRAYQLTARVALQFAAKQSERERIARELHDTLLQGTQGLIFAVQSAARQIAADDPARVILEQAMNRADAAMAEGRDRIEELRTTRNALIDFPRDLALVGEELATERGIGFRFDVNGLPRPLTSEVMEEAYGICREAILNAFRHAKPSEVGVQVDWERQRLRVVVRDDGVGIHADLVDATALAGHWGLAGMRERATKLKASLDIRGKPLRGTEVELSIPASVAYGRLPFRWLWLYTGRSGRASP